jgi:hypothetical protein
LSAVVRGVTMVSLTVGLRELYVIVIVLIYVPSTTSTTIMNTDDFWNEWILGTGYWFVKYV